MSKIAEMKAKKFGCRLLAMLLLVPAAWAGTYQHGTVVRMRMGSCMPEHHSFMMAMSGGGGPQNGPEICPEYTLLSDRVVYVIVGKSSNQLVPLADEIDFRLQNTEMAVRVDDAKRESKFAIKEMILRSEWDLVQKHIVERLTAPAGTGEDDLVLRTAR